MIASASARLRAVRTLDVGVKSNGHASFFTAESKITLEALARVDFVAPVIEMIGIFKSLIKGRISIISFVSPEFEKNNTTSSFETTPISPCRASAACKNMDGVPVLEKVAAVLAAI